jgi:uncharacterized protein (DUF488 family)
MKKLRTIGYEGATVNAFLATLQEAGIQLLVDVRAVASSRRPGFAKTRLAANLAGAGIDYLHLRGLGTPADGRAAARGGRPHEMQRIYHAHLETDDARDALHSLVDLIAGDRQVCILCFEHDPQHCHRSLVADAVNRITPIEVEHLFADDADDDEEERD